MRLLTRLVAFGIIIGLALAVGFFGPEKAEASHQFLKFPWTFGKQGYITQGYNGSSHQNGDYYALDIDIDFGGTLGSVSAAAAGIVVGRVTSQTCSGVGYGNYVDVRGTTPSGATRYAGTPTFLR